MLLNKSVIGLVDLLGEKNGVKKNQFQVTEALRALGGQTMLESAWWALQLHGPCLGQGQ